MSAELVTPEALARELGDPDLVVLDTTVDLRRPAQGGAYAPRADREGFETEHLPGARFADLVDALAEPGAPQAFAWPSPERFANPTFAEAKSIIRRSIYIAKTRSQRGVDRITGRSMAYRCIEVA